LLDNENPSLTFDLLGLSKTVIPFFHWALQLGGGYWIAICALLSLKKTASVT